MQRRAGHNNNITTTIGYVKTAEDAAGSIGEPFPLLATCLVSPDPDRRRGERLEQKTLPRLGNARRDGVPRGIRTPKRYVLKRPRRPRGSPRKRPDR